MPVNTLSSTQINLQRTSLQLEMGQKKKKKKKKCRAGDQGNRRQTWEPFLCFAFPYKMTASRTAFSASSAEHSST